MSLKDMLECIKNRDLVSLKEIMEDEETYLTSKICTKLLIECFERNYMSIASYIIQYDFDLDSDIFENYLENNRPFTQKQLDNLNKLLGVKFICCMVNN
jgi:hypothetical protein